MEEKVPKLVASIPVPRSREMDRVVDIKRVRLELQSDFLAIGNSRRTPHVQIGIVAEQTARTRPRA